MNLPLKILLAVKRIAVALPPARLLVCGINLFSTLAGVAVGPHGVDDPKLGSASGLTRTLNDAWPERSLRTQRLLDACLESARNDSRPVVLA